METEHIWSYRGWKKSWTSLDDWNPINYGINHLSTGAGFLPSTVLYHSVKHLDTTTLQPQQVFTKLSMMQIRYLSTGEENEEEQKAQEEQGDHKEESEDEKNETKKNKNYWMPMSPCFKGWLLGLYTKFARVLSLRNSRLGTHNTGMDCWCYKLPANQLRWRSNKNLPWDVTHCHDPRCNWVRVCPKHPQTVLFPRLPGEGC